MSKPKKEKDPSFEEGLKQLEAIVAEMESGEISLETLVERYREGAAALKRCEGQLKQAELRIEALTKADPDSPEFTDFDPER